MNTQSALIPEHLSRASLFCELGSRDLERVAQATTAVHLARGEVLFRRNDPCVGFHIVVYGQIKLYFKTDQGHEKVARLIGDGESFGEALMFVDKPYILDAQALCDSLLLHVAKEALFDMLDRDGKLARRLLASLSQRLHARMSDIKAYSLQTGAQRVVGYLMHANDCRDGCQFRLETSKTVIASRLNLTPEHFSRILRELADKNMIEVDGRQITLLDVQALTNYQG